MPRKSVVELTDRPDTTLDVYCGRKTTIQQYNIKGTGLLNVFSRLDEGKEIIIVIQNIKEYNNIW